MIQKHRVPGVLLTSGDRHGVRVFHIPRPSGCSFYEFEPASLGGRGDGPPATNPKGGTHLSGVAGKAPSASSVLTPRCPIRRSVGCVTGTRVPRDRELGLPGWFAAIGLSVMLEQPDSREILCFRVVVPSVVSQFDVPKVSW